MRLQPNPTWAVPRKFNTCGEKKKKKKGEGREKGKRRSKGRRDQQEEKKRGKSWLVCFETEMSRGLVIA